MPPSTCFAHWGWEVRDVRVPHLSYSCAAGYNNIMRVEGFQYHFLNFRTRRERYGRAFRNIGRGGFLAVRDYLRAQQARSLICDELRQVFKEIDILLLPVSPSSPTRPGGSADPRDTDGAQYAIKGADPKVNKGSLMHGAAYTCPFNLTGSPSLAVPCGFNSAGMPTGMQLIGRAFEEALLLAAGHQYQLATDWHRRHPDPTSWKRS